MKKGHLGLWFAVLLVAIGIWAILVDIAEENPLMVGLGLGLPFAIFVFAVIRFPIFRERVWAGLKITSKDLAESLSGSEEIKQRRGEGRFVPKYRKHQVIERASKKCENPDCRYPYHLEYHHIDKNVHNNSINNLAFVCRNCHKMVHAGGYIREVVESWIKRRVYKK